MPRSPKHTAYFLWVQSSLRHTFHQNSADAYGIADTLLYGVSHVFVQRAAGVNARWRVAPPTASSILSHLTVHASDYSLCSRSPTCHIPEWCIGKYSSFDCHASASFLCIWRTFRVHAFYEQPMMLDAIYHCRTFLV